jgi:hypothetical protein
VSGNQIKLFDPFGSPILLVSPQFLFNKIQQGLHLIQGWFLFPFEKSPVEPRMAMDHPRPGRQIGGS